MSEKIFLGTIIFLEMIQSLWTEVSSSKNESNYKYYWWRISFKKQLIKFLKKRCTNVLSDFELFIININVLRYNFDPTYFSDCELQLGKLVKIKDELKKKEFKIYKRHKQIMLKQNLSVFDFYSLLIF